MSNSHHKESHCSGIADDDSLQRRREFMECPLEERREIMERQAEELQQHYEDALGECDDIQGGDIVEDDE